MVVAGDDRTRRRIIGGLAAAALQLLIGIALIIGLRVDFPVRLAERLHIFEVMAVPPPPVPPPAKAVRKKARSAAAPTNRIARAAAIVAPPAVLPPPPPPVTAAIVAGTGSDASAGAATPGPGTGAGGAGNGTGGGGDGDGGTPAEWLRGEIRASDYPRAALQAGIGGTVRIRLAIDPRGRVSDCAITQSSGNAELDETTCRLIRKRFRYAPARDASGQAVSDSETGRQVWVPHDPPSGG